MASIIEANIRTLIAQASNNVADSATAHARLDGAFDELQKLKADNAFLGTDGEGDSAHMNPDLVLLLCEAAITAQHTNLAKKCLVALLQGSTTTRSFQIRAVFCQAQVEASEAENLRGERLVQATVDALMKVIQGMKIALQDVNELSSLLYRGAQYIWSICRGLFREGTYATIVSAIGFVVYCLEAVDFSSWQERIGWMLRYAIALNGSGRHAEAAAYLTKIDDLATKVAPHMSHAIYKLQVVVSQHAPNPKLKADAARGILKTIYAAQAFLCGLLNDKAQAEVELSAALVEWKQEAAFAAEAAKRLEDAPLDLRGGLQGAKKGQTKPPPKNARGKGGVMGPVTKEGLDAESVLRDDALADLGLSFVLNGQFEQAEMCADFMEKSKQLKVRVFGEYVRTYLEVERYGGFAAQEAQHASNIPAEVISKLVASVRKIERSLESSVRVEPARDRTYATEVGCVFLWKIALPLLQESTRRQISRPLHSAAKAIDDTSSNMNELRVLLNYESGVCDADEEYLNKASVRIDKALSIDYSPRPEECQLYSLDRPLDRLIVWSKRRLETKSNLYKKHQNPVDEALLIIEQSRDAPVNSRISMLTRAMSSMQASEPPLDFFVESPPSSPAMSPSPELIAKGGGARPLKGTTLSSNAKSTDATKSLPPKTGGAKPEGAPRALDMDVERKRALLRDRANVWNLVMTYGWLEHNVRQVDVVTHAAERILERVWVRSGDRDMRIMQVQAHITLVQTQCVELQSKGLRIGQLSFAEDEDSDDQEEQQTATSRFRKTGGNRDAAIATEISEKMATVSTATKSVRDHINAAANMARDLISEGWPDEWLLLNVAVLTWNTFLPCFLSNDYLSASESLDGVFPMLMSPACGIDPMSEISLFQDLGHAYIQSLLQHHLLSSVAPDGDEEPLTPQTILRVSQLPIRQVTIEADPTSPCLLSAATMCEQCIAAFRTPMDAKNFLLLAPTIRRFLGPSPPEPLAASARPLSQQQLLMHIEELNFPQITVDQRNGLVPRCLDLLSDDPNVELCARLAEAILDSHPKATARVALVGRDLFKSGRLGVQQDERRFLHTAGGAPSGLRATSKEGTKDKKKIKEEQSALQAEQEAALAAALEAAPVPPPTPTDWMWYSLLLQYQAAATVKLIDPSLQEKRTQFEIRTQALNVLSESSLAALQAPREFTSANVMKNMRHYHQVSEEIANDPTWRHLTYDSIATMMSGKLLVACSPLSVSRPHPSIPSDADVISALMLMLLGILTDTGRIEEGLALMKVAIGTLPASHHRPFWSLDIQIRCQGGLPTQQTLVRVKEFSAEMQAQAWLSLCRHSPDPKDQMFAYQKAVEVLKDSTTERAEVMVSMAQWALSSNAPMSIEEARTMVITAIDIVMDECDVLPSLGGAALGEYLTDPAVESDAMSASGVGKHPKSAAGRRSQSAARSANSHTTATTGQPKKRATVKQLVLLIKAYYVLAKIGGLRPLHCIGLLVDARTSFRMLTLVCLTLWQNTAVGANEYVSRQAARQERKETKTQLIAQKNATSKAGVTPRESEKAAKKPAGSAPKAPVRAPTTPVTKFPDPVELPSQVEDWMLFVISPTLIATLQELTMDAAVGPASIGDASQIVGILRDTVADMAKMGLEWECGPILSLAELIIRITGPLSDPHTRAAALENHFTRWDLCYRLNLGASALPVSSVQPMPSGTDRAALMEDAKLVESRNIQIKRRKKVGVSPVFVAHVGNPKSPIHVFWVSIAAHLVAQGRIGQACDLLQDARFHARAFRDAASFAHCNLLDAKIAFLEGRFNESIGCAKVAADLSLDSDENCDWDGGAVPVETVAAATGLIAECHLQMHDIDMGFRTVYGLIEKLNSWMSAKTGLWKDAVALTTPAALCATVTSFVASVLSAISQYELLNRTHPKRERKPGSMELVASSSEAVMHAGRLLSELSPLLDSCPQYESTVLLLETRINEIHAVESILAGDAVASKLALQMEAKALLEAVTSLKTQLSGLGEQRGLTQPGNCGEAATAAAVALAEVLTALGDNVLRRVQLNHVLLDDLRQSTVTSVTAPVVEGAPAELHGEVVRFMRSSTKQRDANKRKNVRQAKRMEVASLRAKARDAKQLEIDRLRELRRQDELLVSSLAAQAPQGRKEVVKKGKGRRDTVENTMSSQQDPIQNVDPDDKFGIDSVCTSSDSGLDEDNQSDEEQELELALKGLPDVAIEARLTFGDALMYFSQAQELLGASRGGGSRATEDINFKIGRCMMLMEERAIVASDERSAILSGKEPPRLDCSPSILAKWNVPAETIFAAGDEPKKVVPNKKEEKPGKRSGGLSARGEGAVSAMSNNLNQQQPTVIAQAIPIHTAVQSMVGTATHRAAQAVALLATSALQAHHTGSLVPLASAMTNLATSAVLLGELDVAGLCLEYAQAASTVHFLNNLWSDVAIPDTPEAALLRLVADIERYSPHLRESAQFSGILKLVHLHSPMTARLGLPEPTFLRELAPAFIVDKVDHDIHIPQEMCVVTLNVIESTTSRLVTVIMSVRRPAGPFIIRRAQIPADRLFKLVQQRRTIASLRKSHLTSMASSSAQSNASRATDDLFVQYVEDTESALHDLFNELSQPLSSIAQKCQLVLCVHPTLAPLPLEALDVFNRFRSVSRDISLFTLQQRLLRREAEGGKINTANTIVVVDPFAENDGLSHQTVYADVRPKISSWVTVGSVIDSDGFSRPVQKETLISACTNPNSAAMVVNMAGRLTSLLSLSEIASLSLEHLRAVFLLDTSVIEKALRRESQQIMTKSAQTILFEASSWCLPLLLLARGVDYLAINSMPSSAAFNDFVSRTVVASLERTTSSFTDTICACVGREPGFGLHTPGGAGSEVGDDAPASRHDSPLGTRTTSVLSRGAAPSRSLVNTPYQQAGSFSALERFGLVFYGVSPVDEGSRK